MLMLVTDEYVLYQGTLMTHLEGLQELVGLLESLKSYAEMGDKLLIPFLRKYCADLCTIEFALEEE